MMGDTWDMKIAKAPGMIVLSMMVLVGLVSTGLVFADSPVEGRAGRAEVRFLEGMIDHHQMALDMANDCLKKAQADSLKKLCQTIINAQSAEIKTMQSWLSAWYNIDYKPMPMAYMMDMMNKSDMGNMMMGGIRKGGHGGMGGMMMPDDPPMTMGMMAGLSTLTGRDYDIAWLEAMIDHHDDAVNMSNRILQFAQHGELRDLAAKIIKDQTAEIKLMEEMITTLSVA